MVLPGFAVAGGKNITAEPGTQSSNSFLSPQFLLAQNEGDAAPEHSRVARKGCLRAMKLQILSPFYHPGAVVR